MDSIDWDSFSLTPARMAEGDNKAEVHLPSKLNLRGGVAEQVQGWQIYDGRLCNSPVIVCSLCGSWDDDDAMTLVEQDEDIAANGMVSKKEQDWINKMVGATASTHDRWVEAFCDELQQGPYPVFEHVYNCDLTLSDCETREEGEEAERA
jgi:hypothetical protein